MKSQMKARIAAGRSWAEAHPARVRAIAVVAVIGLSILAFSGPFLIPEEAARHLSAYADGPRDLSRFLDVVREVTSGDDAADPAALATSAYFVESVRDPKTHVLFVFGVEKPYTAGEAAAILRFVENGGTLVLANDVGNANVLSREFGVLFGDLVVLDRQNYNGKPEFARVTVPFSGRDFNIALNAPVFATIVEGADVEVLASSSAESFIDVDRDGEIDINDQPGPFPLIMRTDHGAGRVVFIADTGLFMNELISQPGLDNAAFARALASSTLAAASGDSGAAPVVLIDESRHVAPPTYRAGDDALRLFVLATTTPTVRVVFALLILGAAIAAILMTRDTEDWSKHHFSVGEVLRAPRSLSPTADRMQALAARAVSEKYNVPIEYLESASVDEIVRLTGDRELAAVAKGAERVSDPRSLYKKLADTVPTQVPDRGG